VFEDISCKYRTPQKAEQSTRVVVVVVVAVVMVAAAEEEDMVKVGDVNVTAASQEQSSQLHPLR